MPIPDADLISRYQSLVKQSADIITLAAPDGTIEYQSPSIERVLGYDQDALVGESVFDYVHPEDRDRIRSAVEAAAEAPSDEVTQAEYRFRHRDGSWVWLASVENDDVAVRFADHGPGFPDELKTRLFGKGEKGFDSTAARSTPRTTSRPGRCSSSGCPSSTAVSLTRPRPRRRGS